MSVFLNTLYISYENFIWFCDSVMRSTLKEVGLGVGSTIFCLW